MRTNVFFKTSGKQAGGTGRSSTASGFSSTMGYPTSGAPVQLKLNPDDFKFLEAYGLNLTDMDEFAARVRQLSPAAASAALGLFEEDRKPTPENRAEWDLAKELLRKAAGQTSASATEAASNRTPSLEEYYGLPPKTGASAATTLEDYYGLPPKAAEEEDDDSPLPADNVSATAVAPPSKTEKQDAGRRVNDAISDWNASTPLPSGHAARALIADFHLGHESVFFNTDKSRLFAALVLLPISPKHLYNATRILFKGANAAYLANADVMATYSARIEALSEGDFQRMLAEIADFADRDVLHGAVGHKAVGERLAQLPTLVKLHVFVFPGADKAKVEAAVKATNKWYADSNIGILHKVTEVRPAQAQPHFENGAFIPMFQDYAAKFVHSQDAKKASDPDTLRRQFPATAGFVPVYAFGKFQNADPDGHALGVTFQLEQRQRDPNAIIVLGPDNSDPLVLAHELGHYLGGHVGGAHVERRDNLMYAQAGAEAKRITLVQQLFFKTSPAASTTK